MNGPCGGTRDPPLRNQKLRKECVLIVTIALLHFSNEESTGCPRHLSDDVGAVLRFAIRHGCYTLPGSDLRK